MNGMNVIELPLSETKFPASPSPTIRGRERRIKPSEGCFIASSKEGWPKIVAISEKSLMSV